MGDLTALTTFLEDDGGFSTPPLPSRKYPEGHVYRVVSPDAITGLRLSALADLAIKYQGGGGAVTEADVKRLHLDDHDERNFIEQVLGFETVEAMTKDGCSWEHVRRIAQYGYIFFTAGEEAAGRALKAGILKGKVPAPNRAAKRKKPKAAGATPTTSASQGSKKAR